MGSPTTEQPTPSLNPAMVFRTPPPESQPLLGREAGDGGREGTSPVKLRFHVNFLRLFNILCCIVDITVLAAANMMRSAVAVALVVFSVFVLVWNAIVLIEWAARHFKWHLGSVMTPTCLCQLGGFRISFGEREDDGSSPKPSKNTYWAVDILISFPLLICAIIFTVQPYFYSPLPVVAATFVWIIFALCIIAAILERSRWRRGVVVTIVPDEDDEESSYEYRIRLPVSTRAPAARPGEGVSITA